MEFRSAIIKAPTGSSRTATFVASDETEDRMGDVIRASGWDLSEFQKNPVLLWGHQSDQPPIGKVTSIGIQDKRLVADAEFATKAQNPWAENIYQMVKAGIIRAVSVGFIPTETRTRKDEKGNYLGIEFIKQALYELSVVSVPANPNALALAKSMHMNPDDIQKLFSEPVVPDSVSIRRKHLEIIKLRLSAL